MSSSGASRIAISQFVLFLMLTLTFLLLGVTIEEKDDPNFRVTRRALYVVTVLFLFPLTLSLVLLYGVLKENIAFIRIWLIFITLLSTILLFILLSGAIYVTVNKQVHWGIALCTMPFVLTSWLAEGMIVVFSYYRKLDAKTKKLIPV